MVATTTKWLFLLIFLLCGSYIQSMNILKPYDNSTDTKIDLICPLFMVTVVSAYQEAKKKMVELFFTEQLANMPINHDKTD